MVIPATKSFPLVGKRIETDRGLLKVLHSDTVRGYRPYYWVECFCGIVFSSQGRGLGTRTRSCGCVSRKQPTHGKTNSPEFKVWQGMIDRCTRPKATGYDRYGKRGISIEDPRWFSFAEFYKDMGMRPPGLTLERKDNSKGYCKDNCVWATRKEQAHNTRRNVWITFEGKRMILADWSRKLGRDAANISRYLKEGKDMQWIVNHFQSTAKRRSNGHPC